MNWKPRLGAATLVAGLSLSALVGCSNNNTAGTTGQSTTVQTQSTQPATAQRTESSAHAGHTTNMAASPSPHEGHTASSSATSSGSGGHHNMGSKSMQALESLQGKEFDIAFLSQMITHHEGALDMSEQALQAAKRPETKEDAQKIIDAQKKEIEQMRGWLKSWYNTEPDPKQQALMEEDMKSMMAMPIKDDKSFYEMMILHHQGAIDMAAIVDHHSQKAELKELAQKIAADQKAEIQRFQQLAAMDEE